MGVADGLASASCGQVLVRERRVPILSMSLEHTSLDLTDVAQASGRRSRGGRQQGWKVIPPDEVIVHHHFRSPAALRCRCEARCARLSARGIVVWSLRVLHRSAETETKPEAALVLQPARRLASPSRVAARSACAFSTLARSARTNRVYGATASRRRRAEASISRSNWSAAPPPAAPQAGHLGFELGLRAAAPCGNDVEADDSQHAGGDDSGDVDG